MPPLRPLRPGAAASVAAPPATAHTPRTPRPLATALLVVVMDGGVDLSPHPVVGLAGLRHRLLVPVCLQGSGPA